MTPSNPTDLFITHHQFKTDLMIDTVIQIYAKLKKNGIVFSENTIHAMASEIWCDSLNLIQEGQEPNIVFMLDGDEDLEVG